MVMVTDMNLLFVASLGHYLSGFILATRLFKNISYYRSLVLTAMSLHTC